MAYKKTTWINGQTKLNADNLNNIENGISNALENKVDDKTILNVADTYLSETSSSNVIERPYIDGNGQFSSMVNNVHDDNKNSDYQYRLNFDGENDNAYIDTHLSKTGSIYTAVIGENAAININLLGDNSLLFAQLDGYSNIRFIAKGNEDNKALEFLYIATDYKDKPLTGAPLLLLKNDGKNDIKYGLAYDVQNNKLGYATKEDGQYAFHENDTFVARKTGEGFKLYGHAGATEVELPYDLLATADTVALRTSNGNVLMTEPTENLAGANKKYVDDIANNKLDKLTTDTTGLNAKLYAHSGTDQIEFGTTAFSMENTIPYRNENGTFDVKTPINQSNVANKEYVDNLITTLKNMLVPTAPSSFEIATEGRQATTEEATFMTSLNNAVAVKIDIFYCPIIGYVNNDSQIEITFANFDIDASGSINSLEQYSAMYVKSTGIITIERTTI